MARVKRIKCKCTGSFPRYSVKGTPVPTMHMAGCPFYTPPRFCVACAATIANPTGEPFPYCDSCQSIHDASISRLVADRTRQDMVEHLQQTQRRLTRLAEEIGEVTAHVASGDNAYYTPTRAAQRVQHDVLWGLAHLDLERLTDQAACLNAALLVDEASRKVAAPYLFPPCGFIFDRPTTTLDAFCRAMSEVGAGVALQGAATVLGIVGDIVARLHEETVLDRTDLSAAA